MTEKVLSLALTKALRLGLHGSVVIKHCERFTSGVPDITVTWNGRTTWLELKHRSIVGTGVQDLTAQRLATAGSCCYVLYAENPKVTKVIHPVNREVLDSAPGHHPNFVVEFIRRLHDLKN